MQSREQRYAARFVREHGLPPLRERFDVRELLNRIHQQSGGAEPLEFLPTPEEMLADSSA